MVRIFKHREMQGELQQLHIKYDAGEWYAIFIVERESPRKPELESIPEDRIRGIDMGLEKFMTLDNGYFEEYPGFHRASEEKVKVLQRYLSHKHRGSRRYRALALRLARLHLQVKRRREDFQNKLVSKLFKDNDALVIEKLSVHNMLQNHRLAKSIADASWGKFARTVLYQADMLGKLVIATDPWGTTQLCHSCLQWAPKDLSNREHMCLHCQVVMPRDLNSAKLIKWLGILTRSSPSDGGSSLAELSLYQPPEG